MDSSGGGRSGVEWKCKDGCEEKDQQTELGIRCEEDGGGNVGRGRGVMMTG